MRRKLLITALAAVLSVAPVAPALAAATYSNGTATANFNVTLTLSANCLISASPLSFGSSTALNVGLDGGTVTGSTVTNRLLAGTSTGNTNTTLSFQLYQNAAMTTIWGNTQATNTVGGTGTGSAQSLTVYGQVPTQTAPKPDTYQTTVTATVFF